MCPEMGVKKDKPTTMANTQHCASNTLIIMCLVSHAKNSQNFSVNICLTYKIGFAYLNQKSCPEYF